MYNTPLEDYLQAIGDEVQVLDSKRASGGTI